MRSLQCERLSTETADKREARQRDFETIQQLGCNRIERNTENSERWECLTNVPHKQRCKDSCRFGYTGGPEG